MVGSTFGLIALALVFTFAAGDMYGYVERSANGPDGRQRHVSLTPRGVQLLAAVEEIYTELEREWASLIGPAVVGIRHRLSTGEDYDALARDVLNATIAGLQAGVTTTFVSCKCAEEGIAGALVPAGVRSYESE